MHMQNRIKKFSTGNANSNGDSKNKFICKESDTAMIMPITEPRKNDDNTKERASKIYAF